MSMPFRCRRSRKVIIGGIASPTPSLGLLGPLAVSCCCEPSRVLVCSSKTATTFVPPMLNRAMVHRRILVACPSRMTKSGWIRRSRRRRGWSRKALLRIYEGMGQVIGKGKTGRYWFDAGAEREAVPLMPMGPAGEGRFGNGRDWLDRWWKIREESLSGI